MCHGSDSQGGCILLRIESENRGSFRGEDGEVVNMASGLLLSQRDRMERVLGSWGHINCLGWVAAKKGFMV